MVSTTATNLDLAQRASFKSTNSPSRPGDGFASLKSPNVDVESGALREGGAPTLLSKDCIGVIAQYAAVGLVDAVLPATVYPVLQNYLNASGTTAVTALTLVRLPWSFKFFYGVLSDCVPICGYRRRPYMVVGWVVCIAMLLVMGFTPMGKPYWAHPDDAHIDLNTDPQAYAAAVGRANARAPTSGGKYVILMMLSAFGYLLSDVCADGVVVELAQREPLASQGTTQATIYGTRTAFNMVGQLLTGFAFNGHEYGGDFDFSLSFPTLMLVVGIVLCPIIPITWYLIKEEKHAPSVVSEYMSELWRVVQTRAVYQVLFYTFFANMFAGITYTAASPVQSILVHVTPINNTLSTVISSLAFMVGLATTGTYGLHWNWRSMIVFTGVAVILLDGVATFVTVWDAFRSQWFWLGLPMAAQLPFGVSNLISSFVIVELAGEGLEGAMYGLFTTVSNLSTPFAATLTKIIDRNWDLSNERIKTDTTAVRWDMTYTILIMYASNAFSWVFLVLLPRQKEETQRLKHTGGTSKLWGAWTVLYILFAFVWSVTTNLLGIFTSTSCLIVAGGNGC